MEEGVDNSSWSWLLLTSSFQDQGPKIMEPQAEKVDTGPTYEIADNGRWFRDHLGHQTKWPRLGDGAGHEQSVPTTVGLFACGPVYLPMSPHIHIVLSYTSAVSQTFFFLFVNLYNVWLKIDGFLFLLLYSICCNITYHVASRWKIPLQMLK